MLGPTLSIAASNSRGSLYQLPNRKTQHDNQLPAFSWTYSAAELKKVPITQMDETSASHELQASIDDIEDRLHTIQLLDEIDNLMCQVIICTVDCCDSEALQYGF